MVDVGLSANKARLRSCCVLALLVSPAAPVLAQVADTAAAEAVPATDQGDGGEIIVTAQRTRQSIQNVPVAISAFGAADLANRQIQGLRDIAAIVPGLYVEENLNNTSTPKLFMRGIGIDNSAFSFDSPVGVYVDDVYYPRAVGSLVDFFDIDRIEVLRGPQGTIYGRNSSIGAVRVITRAAPLDEIDGKVDLTYGTRNQFNVRGTVGVPLIADKLGFRLSYNHKQNDGFQLNVANGERVKSDDTNAIRGQLLWQVSDHTSVTVRGDWLRDRGRETAASRFLNDADNDLLTYSSELSYKDGTAINKVDTYGTSATLKSDLGGVELTSISAWRGIKTTKRFDVDGTTAARFEIDRGDLRERELTQEVFLTGNDIGSLPVSWVAGAFYLREISDYVYAQRVISPPPVVSFHQVLDSPAAYAQFTWRATDRWNITGGARYTYETKDFDANGVSPTGLPTFAFTANDLNKSKVTWRGATDYKLTDDVLLFASVSTGFRSGGLNGNAGTAAEVTSGAYGPEDTLMYEGGFKSSFFDRKLVVNASYYFGKYSGLQQAITLISGATSAVNNNARVRGLDLDVTARPLPGLMLSSTMSLFHSNVLESALVLKDSPKFSITLNGVYSRQIGSAGTASVGATYKHTGFVYENTANTLIVATPAHDNVDTFVSYEFPDRHWKITAGVYNATDKVYSAGGFFIAGGAIAAVKYPTLPRRYYGTLSYQF